MCRASNWAVGVHVDGDVDAAADRLGEAGLQRRAHTAVGSVRDHPGACAARELGRVVGRAVVDHEHLDRTDAGDRFRDRSNHLGDRHRLVESREDDEEALPGELVVAIIDRTGTCDGRLADVASHLFFAGAERESHAERAI